MLKKATFKFLSSVAKHNNREWFADNKDTYEAARADVIEFTEVLISRLAKVDKLFSADTQAKKCVLRIYRDVRFSKNKDPYKQNFGIWFSAAGRDGSGPGYYLHLQPGKSFFGAGYWQPSPEHLKLIRQEIDYNGAELHEIIDDKKFQDTVDFSFSDTLKNAPKGYEQDHGDLRYLKLKSFEVSRPISDDEFFDPKIVNKLISYCEIVFPYIAFLRNALSA
ncbi:MAG: DUF2461 domain-containing protein [Pedobacter sp.]|nr:MAG: DUF2461 domain-containing protein [Pedobacter sp.]